MMKVNLKHVVEIAGGLVLGSLASGAVNGVVKGAGKVVKKVGEKKKRYRELKDIEEAAN